MTDAEDRTEPQSNPQSDPQSDPQSSPQSSPQINRRYEATDAGTSNRAVRSLQLRDPGKDRQLMCAKPIDREAPHTLGASAAINPKKVE